MFCPKCAAQNIEGASFCRVCGANIGLVPQALTGKLPEPRTLRNQRGRGRRRDRQQEPASFERGIINVFGGLGFIVAALFIMWKFPGGVFWGWALFFPGFGALGKGIAMIAAAQREQQSALPPAQNSEPFLTNQVRNVTQPFIPPPPGRNTGELLPQPPSVTEGTTRHLGAEAPTRHLDSE
jgi:hypothetical protein